ANLRQLLGMFPLFRRGLQVKSIPFVPIELVAADGGLVLCGAIVRQGGRVVWIMPRAPVLDKIVLEGRRFGDAEGMERCWVVAQPQTIITAGKFGITEKDP